MLGRDEIDRVPGRDVYGLDGEKIGTARQVYTDDQTGEPAWVTVRTGLLAHKESFVPLREAQTPGGRLTVPYTKDYVQHAPSIDEDGHISPGQEKELFAYYGRADEDAGGDYKAGRTGRGHFEPARSGRGGSEAGVTERGDDGTGDHDDAEAYSSAGTASDMTVSEERVNVGMQRRESGRARLRKYVVTEHVTQTVPVQREEVRVEREPIAGSNRDTANARSDISEDSREVVLHEEQPVVEKETVPVERVRLATETVTDQQTVAEDVRRERVDIEKGITRGYN